MGFRLEVHLPIVDEHVRCPVQRRTVGVDTCGSCRQVRRVVSRHDTSQVICEPWARNSPTGGLPSDSLVAAPGAAISGHRRLVPIPALSSFSSRVEAPEPPCSARGALRGCLLEGGEVCDQCVQLPRGEYSAPVRHAHDRGLSETLPDTITSLIF